MAAISSYGYSNISRRILDAAPGIQETTVTLQIGNGVDTYPTGGLALNGGQIGMVNSIESIIFLDSPIAGGYFPGYNVATGKIMLYTSGAVEISNALTPNASLRCIVRGY